MNNVDASTLMAIVPDSTVIKARLFLIPKKISQQNKPLSLQVFHIGSPLLKTKILSHA
jgi:hypothetical protein